MKRWVAVFMLLAVLSAGCLAGCGKDANDADAGEKPQTGAGSLMIEDVYLYENFPTARIYVQFGNPQYGGEVRYTYDTDLFTIENGVAVLEKAPDREKRVTVYAETEDAEAFFEVICGGIFEAGLSYTAEKLENDLHDSYRSGGLIFAGDSFFSASYWNGFSAQFEGKAAYAAGISASTAEQWRLFARRVLYPFRPAAVALHVGTNDLAGTAGVSGTVGNLCALFDELLYNLPETQFYWFTIEPRAGVSSADIQQVNGAVAEYAEKHAGLIVLDSYTLFADGDGSQKEGMFADGVHPSAEGYKVFPRLLAEAGVRIPDR